MKKKLFLAVLLLIPITLRLCFVGCQQAPKQATENTSTPEEESPVVVFNEENFPDTPLDLNAYSAGIQHIGLPTSDVQKTIDFYTTLGFELATRHDIGGRDFAFMKLGNLLIEVIPNSNPAMTNGAVDHFCLDVKNIDELFAKVKECGYTMLDENINDIAFWKNGARYFFIQGPNNEKIEFCEIL